MANDEKPTGSQAAQENCGFLIVGVGASAGGLEALKQLFDAMPDAPGMAFMVIQHLDPTRESLTAELLDKHTSMRVTQVEDEPRVLPNRVYVIPPNKYLSIESGALHLAAPDEPRGSRMAIDHFLRSLAKDQRQCAVAIILSGTGSDGSLGVKAVKAQGGLVIAQDPATAGHAGMPRSAMATGTVDYVLPCEEMAGRLVRYAQHPYVRESAKEAAEAAPPGGLAETSTNAGADADLEHTRPDDLSPILSLLKARTQLDFHGYKDKTLFRRTCRRMSLHHLNDYAEYLALLRDNPAEMDALVRDLLITVTDFFRDSDAWEALEQHVVPRIVRDKQPGEAIRAWAPGCATGEEAYSLAMLLIEATTAADCLRQIFASDVDSEALEVARQGRYPQSIVADVSRARLKRFFTRVKDDGQGYAVSKSLRESVVFAEQNLIVDPPFSKLDLICCRNLLIYIKPEFQEKIIRLFHFALAEGGYLFLGNSETVGRHSDLFETVDKRWRIFRSLGKNRPEQVRLPLVSGAGGRRTTGVRQERPQQSASGLENRAQQVLLDFLSPSAVVVDSQWRIQYISGNVDGYLTHSAGVPNDDLLQKCRRGLRNKTRGAVQKALQEERTVVIPARVQRDGKYEDVRLVVRPFAAQQEEQPLALIVFEEVPARRDQTRSQRDDAVGDATDDAAGDATMDDGEPRGDGSGPNGDLLETDIDGDSAIRQLEDELSATKEDLLQTIEQSEISQEELKAANEEVMSVNEELQSTNEELETSKEELESVNEELSTVNHQLAGKVEELETKHADLENLIAATEVATICLDTELKIRWFTPAATRLFRIGTNDRGRPVSDFSHDFPEGDLPEVAQQVFNELTPVEDELEASGGRFFLRRVIPYRSEDHRIRGVVATFVDITARKLAEQELLAAKRISDTIIDSVLLPVLALNPDLRVRRGNQAFYDHFQVSREATEGQLVYELGNRQWDIPRLRELLERVLPEREAIDGFEVEHAFESIGRRTMLLNARRIDNLNLVLLSIEDVTDQKRAQKAIAARNESLETEVSERVLTLSILQDVAMAANKARAIDEAIETTLQRICDYNHWVLGHAYRRKRGEDGVIVSAGVWYTNAGKIDDPERLEQLERFQGMCASTHFAEGEGIIGRVFATGQPLWTEDVAHQPHWRRPDPGELCLGSSIAFPIAVQEEVVTVLECLSDEPIHKEPRFMEIMENVGIQLGHVVERNRLERRIAEAAEREQHRLGNDIHDGIGQELSGLRLLAQTHAESLAQQHLPEHELASRISAGLGIMQQQLRSIIRNLIPVEVDVKGLVAALESLAEATAGGHNVQCNFIGDAGIRIQDNSLATQLYRIAQEAVTNAVRHAAAQHIQIRLQEIDHHIQLEICDDGVGIDSKAKQGDGFGLRSMAFRSQVVGGQMTVEASPDGDSGGGTIVKCVVPRQSISQQHRP